MSGAKVWRARVLYENHRDERSPSFGLHELLCAMVDDLLGQSWFAKRHIDGMTRNGVDKVLRDCGEEAERVFARLALDARFAFVDADELAPRLGLPSRSSLVEIRAELTRSYPAVRMLTPDAGSVSRSNTEELLRVAGRCLDLSENDSLLREALGKSRSARDKIFLKLATNPHQRHARERFRQLQPTIAALVDALTERVRPALSDE